MAGTKDEVLGSNLTIGSYFFFVLRQNFFGDVVVATAAFGKLLDDVGVGIGVGVCVCVCVGFGVGVGVGIDSRLSFISGSGLLVFRLVIVRRFGRRRRRCSRWRRRCRRTFCPRSRSRELSFKLEMKVGTWHEGEINVSNPTVLSSSLGTTLLVLVTMAIKRSNLSTELEPGPWFCNHVWMDSAYRSGPANPRPL